MNRNDIEVKMACVILHNGIYLDTWHDIDNFEIFNDIFIVGYNNKWFKFKKSDGFNVNYFWITPDIIVKQQLTNKVINQMIDKTYEEIKKELEGEN